MASTPEDEFDSDTALFDSPSPPISSGFNSADASPAPMLDTRRPLDIQRPPARTKSTSGATAASMTPSSTPLGNINAARNPLPPSVPSTSSITSRGSGLHVSQDILARIQAVHLGRQGAPPNASVRGPMSPGAGSPAPGMPNMGPSMGPPAGLPGGLPGGLPANFRLPPGAKPSLPNYQSAPVVPRAGVGAKPSMAERRGMKLPGGLPGAAPPVSTPAAGAKKKRPGMTLSQMNGGASDQNQPPKQESMMDRYAEFLDKETGSLRFKGKAVLDSQGVKFSSGATFNISLDEVDTLDELGKGNYGTVYKVRHSRPRMRKPGQGLAGNKAPLGPQQTSEEDESSPTASKPAAGTGIIMAMKEMRLELEDAKFASIIMELDILHRCISPNIVDFYGAFFQEGAVYICMEFMDGGSIDKLYGDGIPENVLRKITLATVRGLKTLKDEHNIIHRDVKPTNILMNTRGQVKICDFGVSGNLVASIAKTNIGCQSYMAPERISSGGIAQAGANPGGGTYSVQSDIWSLGLTIIECALGRYPYPPETYNNIFSQLSAIVDGEPPDLPPVGFSDTARNFVSGCLNKIPNLRPTYAMLLQHAWLAPMVKPETITEEDEEEAEAEAEAAAANPDSAPVVNTDPLNSPGEVVYDKEVADWVKDAIEKRKKGLLGKGAQKPALHAAPLDVMPSPGQNGVSVMDFQS